MRFRKRVVLANAPSFLFSFRGNMRTYPRSGFRSGRTSECTLVPVFVPGEHPPKPPFWKPPFCQPQTEVPSFSGPKILNKSQKGLRGPSGPECHKVLKSPRTLIMTHFCFESFAGPWGLFLDTFLTLQRAREDLFETCWIFRSYAFLSRSFRRFGNYSQERKRHININIFGQ